MLKFITVSLPTNNTPQHKVSTVEGERMWDEVAYPLHHQSNRRGSAEWQARRVSCCLHWVCRGRRIWWGGWAGGSCRCFSLLEDSWTCLQSDPVHTHPNFYLALVFWWATWSLSRRETNPFRYAGNLCNLLCITLQQSKCIKKVNNLSIKKEINKSSRPSLWLQKICAVFEPPVFVVIQWWVVTGATCFSVCGRSRRWWLADSQHIFRRRSDSSICHTAYAAAIRDYNWYHLCDTQLIRIGVLQRVWAENLLLWWGWLSKSLRAQNSRSPNTSRLQSPG